MLVHQEKENQLETPNFKEGTPPPQGESEASEKLVSAVYDVPVQISVILGRVTMPVANLIKLGRGAVLQLDKRVGEKVDILVNDRLIARGEVVIMEEHLGVTITEILRTDHFK
ncbi:MAG: flagellar motor switch protein FliN [Holosporales bacterium]|jgi:flagellar motor switch protein FliN/FliY|nr:flagellar motor switch protein FliN [Holosporales bacterium]